MPTTPFPTRPRPALRVATPRGWWGIDYPTLARWATDRARWLHQAGLRAGQVVLCPTRPAADFALMTHALGALDAALLPVPADTGNRARAGQIGQTGAEWVWVPATEPVPGGAGPGPGRLLATGQAPVVDTHPDPLALLVQTSGSTGTPKVAMLSWGALQASCTRINARLRLRADDAWLCCLPREHIGGLAIGYRCALAGAEWVIQEGFDAEAVQAALAAGDISHVSLVPPMLDRLLARDPRPPAGLRVVLIGGQALDPALARRALAAGWPLYAGYAMTETASQIAGAWVGSAPADEQPADTGPTSTWPDLTPLPDVTLAGAGPCSETSPDGDAGGPLWIRAPMLMAGYANPGRRRGDGLRDGWLVTADLACRTPAGHLRIQGRADDALVIGGVNVLPALVEATLAEAPDIGEVAVVGLPEPVWGFRLVACYTGNAVVANLDGWARAHLPGPHRPRAWRRIAAMPLLGSGKRDSAALRALAASDDH